MNQSTQPSYMQILGQLNLEDIYIQQAFDYYHERYSMSDEYQQFVQESPRIPDELRDHDFVGICDRTLGTRGFVVFPEFDDKGNIISAIGYRFGKRIRHWQEGVIYWEKPVSDGYVQDGLKFIKEVIYGKTCH